MDGLAKTAGLLFREVAVGGKTYRLARPRLADLAAAEAALLAYLPDPLQQAAKAAQYVPQEQRDQFWRWAFAEAAKARKITMETLDSLPPALTVAYIAYTVLHRHHADEIRTLEDALDWVEKAQAEHSDLEAILTSVQDGGPTENPTSP